MRNNNPETVEEVITVSSEGKMLVVHQGEGLIAIPMEIGGEEVTALFATEQAADNADLGSGVQEALELAGAWRDLDFEEMADELDRVRHASPPSPPIDLWFLLYNRQG